MTGIVAIGAVEKDTTAGAALFDRTRLTRGSAGAIMDSDMWKLIALRHIRSSKAQGEKAEGA